MRLTAFLLVLTPLSLPVMASTLRVETPGQHLMQVNLED